MHTPSPFAPPTAGAHAGWDPFVTECVDWMMARVHAGVLTRSPRPDGRLLAVFDVFASWLDGRDAEAGSVVDAVLRASVGRPVGRIVALQAPAVRAIVADLGSQAGLVDVEEFADSWLILVAGTVHGVASGDAAAPTRAGEMARDLVARHRPRPVVGPPAYDEEGEFDWVEDAATPLPARRRGARRAEPVPSNFDWFDVHGWDGEPAPVPYPA